MTGSKLSYNLGAPKRRSAFLKLVNAVSSLSIIAAIKNKVIDDLNLLASPIPRIPPIDRLGAIRAISVANIIK